MSTASAPRDRYWGAQQAADPRPQSPGGHAAGRDFSSTNNDPEERHGVPEEQTHEQREQTLSRQPSAATESDDGDWRRLLYQPGPQGAHKGDDKHKNVHTQQGLHVLPILKSNPQHHSKHDHGRRSNSAAVFL